MKLAIVSTAIGVLLLCSGCVQIVTTQGEPEIEVRTPKPFLGDGPGDLQPTDVKGLFKAPKLDPNCYYYKPKDEWYRFSYNRWFTAYKSWQAEWWEMRDEDVPKYLQGRVALVEGKSKKQKLEDLDKRLEELDRQERLEQQQKQLEQLDREDAEKAAPNATEVEPDSKP